MAARVSLLFGAILGIICNTMLYIAVFTIYLWWITQGLLTTGSPPTIAYILCIAHIAICAMNMWIIYALYKRCNKVVYHWLIIRGIFLLIELVLFVIIYTVYWKITSIYGIADLTLYTLRTISNAWSVYCVQSQYIIWRDDVIKIEALRKTKSDDIPLSYINTPSLKRSSSTMALPSPTTTTTTTTSEFNAAAFTPASVGFLPLISDIVMVPRNNNSNNNNNNNNGKTVYHYYPTILSTDYSTQSLDRKRYMRGITSNGHLYMQDFNRQYINGKFNTQRTNGESIRPEFNGEFNRQGISGVFNRQGINGKFSESIRFPNDVICS
ncbi:hypothetical protein Pcinc_010681 [Petrolisthes cinctipes]|uniref:Uncharacterized protein n=1 Tax=Petrolisthes cinctipes TaxID=88211 RepID=A0AAE1G475_PETCI|nr:hypothetical protein Pcinc_010681 [Petrolisthes cinctipes]